MKHLLLTIKTNKIMKKISKKRANHLLSILKGVIGHYSADFRFELVHDVYACQICVSAPRGFYGSCSIKDIYDFAEEYCHGYLSVCFSSTSNCIIIDLD